MKNFFFSAFFVFQLAAAPTLANCVDLSKGNSFSLIRNDPYFAVSNVVSSDGSVIEKRKMTQNGLSQSVTTTYWNGVVPVDRKSKSSRLQLKVSEDVKSVDLSKPRKTYKFPVSILVNGKETDTGTFEVRTIKKSKVSIGGCRFPVMVVRKSIKRNNGSDINEEALLSLDAGMLLGNVAMTPDWKPRSAVFFDLISVN